MKIPLSAYENAWEMIKRESVGSAAILILVAHDCDAIAACRTLQSLFKLFSMNWTIEPVNSYEDITSAYEMHIKPSKALRSVVMLNCGGAVDLFEELRLYEKPELIVYVFDSHRPYHPNNVKNVNQIMLFDETDDPIVIPTSNADKLARKQLRLAAREERKRQRAEERANKKLAREQQKRKSASANVDADGDIEMSESDIYDDEDEDDRDEEEDDEDDDDEEDEEDEEMYDDDMDGEDYDEMDYDEDDAEDRAKRRQKGFSKLEPSTHAFSSAGLLYALSTKINKDSNEYLWNGILGITDQLIHQRIDRRRYLSNLSHFRNEVARLNLEDDEINSGRGSSASESHRIVYLEREYAFMIYRQWNLYESMCHSRHVAVRLTLWNAQGMKKLETWLAKLGLPLEQVKQPWKAMNPELKTLLPTLLEKKAGELDVDLLFYPSFVRKPMFDKETAASDTVWAVSSLLECSKRLKMQQASDFATGESSSSTSSQDFSKGNFWNAYYALSHQHADLLNAGYNEAMELQKAIMRQIKAILQKNEVGSSGEFRHAILRENPDLKFFCHPLALCKLAHFLVDVLIETKKYKKPKPLLLVAPRVEEALLPASASLPQGQTFTTYLIAGVPAQHSGASFIPNHFGKAFAAAANRIKSTLSYASFDSSVVEIRKEDLFRFTEFLRSGLILEHD